MSLEKADETVAELDMAGGIEETIIDTTQRMTNLVKLATVQQLEPKADGWGSRADIGNVIRTAPLDRAVPSNLSDDDHRNHGRWE